MNFRFYTMMTTGNPENKHRASNSEKDFFS